MDAPDRHRYTDGYSSFFLRLVNFMRYEYSGYLSTLLPAPDPRERDRLDYIEFGAEDLKDWRLVDDEADREWQTIPARCEQQGNSVVLSGFFEDIRRIDVLDPSDPSFWVPLSSKRTNDPRFPIDASRFPIIEITYRCTTEHAHPAWQWTYPGGIHFDGLQPSKDWRRIARLIHYRNFPQQINDLTVRLYGTARVPVEMEIQSIRFRAMSPTEALACSEQLTGLEEKEKPPHYPLLDNFMPMGVYMKAGVAKKLAASMEVSFRDYWRLALEDVARYHHNSVALEEINAMTPGEWRELLGLAASFGIKILAIEEWPLEDFERQGKALVERYIAPHAESSAILGWAIHDEPAEHTFMTHLRARQMIHKADPNHPMVVMTRDPNSYALFGPHFAASGISHFKSGAAWDLGEKIRTHLPLNGGQQLWAVGPSFVYATDTPEWSTCPEMRLMLNLAFANGARGWFSFAYHNSPVWWEGSFQRSLTGPFLTFSDLWAELGHRMERFNGLSSVLLHARPCPPHNLGIDLRSESHQYSRKPDHVPPVQWHWLEGPDYILLYIVNNDVGEVTSVYLNAPDVLPGGLQAFDLTDFVRTRKWVPMKHKRHLEMFPGQGELIFIGEPKVCDQWRDRIIASIVADDRRQIGLDLSLARRYDIDITAVQERMMGVGLHSPLEDLESMRLARDGIVNLLFDAPKLVEPRSKLIQASAAICGIDGVLCRMLAAGRVEHTYQYGHKAVALTQQLIRLRMALRRGKGGEINPLCDKLAEDTVALLHEIRGIMDKRRTVV